MSVLPVGFGSSGAGSSVDIGDDIPYSLMLDSGSSQYLSRTFGAPTDNTSFTLSFWQKRGKQVASYDAIFGASDVTGAIYLKADALCLYKNADVGVSSALMRDFTAWQHVCIISNGTTVKGYLNNVEIVSYTGTMSGINSAVGHWVGVRPVSRMGRDC